MSLISGFVKSLSKLSMIGRALMLPISLLPAAGLLLAFGWVGAMTVTGVAAAMAALCVLTMINRVRRGLQQAATPPQ